MLILGFGWLSEKHTLIAPAGLERRLEAAARKWGGPSWDSRNECGAQAVRANRKPANLLFVQGLVAPDLVSKYG